jgi:hypothetical protein
VEVAAAVDVYGRGWDWEGEAAIFFLISAPLKFLFSKRWFCLHKLQKLVYKPAAAHFKLNIFLR